MYLVAIAWFYVVLMMALAEALSPQGSLLGAGITLLFYGLLPLAVVLYILGAPHRRRARVAAEAAELDAAAAAAEASATAEKAEKAAAAGAVEAAPPASAAAAPPDGGGEAAGGAVAPVRKEA